MKGKCGARRLLRLCGVVFCLAVLYGTGSPSVVGASAQPKTGGEYRIPLESEPGSLDPAFITDIYGVNVAMNLFDGLVEFDENLNVVPAIAEIWKISRDRRAYTFHLRKGVKFHNGREVTADDFVFSFTRILSPETKSPIASLFLNIAGAERFHEGKSATIDGLSALDRHTLRIELKEPFAPFLSTLAMANAKVIPREAVDPQFSREPVGTGPFRFRLWEAGTRIVLDANTDYYGGRPFLDSLHFRIYQNIEWEKIFSGFESGQLEQSIIPSSQFDRIMAGTQELKRASVISKPTLSLIYLGMNVTIPPFDDLRVRQAVSHAVDTEAIVRDITKRGSVQARGILPPGIAGYDPDFQGYRYDPQKAKDLLAESGFPDGRGFPPLEVWTVSRSDSVQKELQAYQKYFAAVGIRLTSRVAENWKEFITLINERKVSLFYAAWYADYPDPDNFLHVLCHSSSKTNRMGYHRPDVDKMLEEARGGADYLKRVELYREIQRRVMFDAPVICQHVNSFNTVFQPWVKGVEVNYLGGAYIPFKKVWFDWGTMGDSLG